MNIAFISYEFPPETGGGGIGTYLTNIVPALREANHIAIVITATKQNHAFWENEFTYRIPSKGAETFNQEILLYFDELHAKYKFDIIEGTDFRGWGVSIKKKFPLIPYVVKLHTPNYLIDLIQFRPLKGFKKLYFILACLLNGKIPKIKSKPNINDYADEKAALNFADRLVSPSISIAEKLSNLQLINSSKKVDYIPFFIPNDKAIFGIKSREKLVEPQILFIGRHEIRKGVIELANAIPLVLKKYPNVHFTFVGSSSFSPNSKLNMADYLKVKLAHYKKNITFIGKVEANAVKKYFDIGDIFVFPSHYESFGLVCTEAMAAGKAIIGSKNGGMAEILDYGSCGILVDSKPEEIYTAIDQLISNNALRLSFGQKARARVNSIYTLDHILSLQLKSYESVISSLSI